ncbi:MAG: hypothetical protein N2487_02725 [Verrucomicrobiae bacterium]|nr:hypothetical protein [Verrucomicrobiae bacterium]
MYSHAIPLAKIIELIRPGFFIKDYELLIKISNAESPDEVNDIVENYLYENPPRGFLRGLLKIRISPEKLTRFALKIMKKQYEI